jgi:hypothetical protein
MYVDPHTGRVVASVVATSRVASAVAGGADVGSLVVSGTIGADEIETVTELVEATDSTEFACT